MELYKWQEEIRDCKGDSTVRGGRQSGKSWGVAHQIVNRAKNYVGSVSLIIAAAERQENYLLDKVKGILGEKHKYKSRVTLTKLHLDNGSIIYKFPVGNTGIYIEGLSSVDFLYVDEAIHVKEKVYDSILPMLLEPKKRGLGWITMLSATRGNAKGFFYDSFQMDRFKKFHIKTADCPHADIKFLEDERQRLGERAYKVVYEGEFDEFAFRYFDEEIIKRAAKFKFWKINKQYQYFLGIDPAGMGKCQAAFVVGEKQQDKMRIIYYELHDKTTLPDLMRITENLNDKFNFRKIYVDNNGIGNGFTDVLTEKFKRKVIALNNRETGKEFKALKEDLYSNTLKLFQFEKIEIIEDEKLIKELIKVEFDEEFKIKGTDTSEALCRVCWAMKEKHYKVKIHSF
jgi:hypothetical protein